MTLLVNQLQSQVTTWKLGNAIVPPNASKADFERRVLNGRLLSRPVTWDARAAPFGSRHPVGTTYAVNGAASGRYKPIEPIWSADQKMMGELKAAGAGGGPTLRINIGDLIEEGRKLCS